MQAFGVGAFEEEDEDIYGREDIASKYNFYLDDDPDGYGQLHTILLPIFEMNHSLTVSFLDRWPQTKCRVTFDTGF